MKHGTLFAGVGFVLIIAGGAAAADLSVRCAAKRSVAVERFVHCYERAAIRGLLRGSLVDDSGCSRNLAKTWATINARYGAACPAVQPLSDVEVAARYSAVGLLARTSANSNAQTCGNGVRDAGEQCDGADLTHLGCSDLGYVGGNLSCSIACTYDVSGCGTGDAMRVFATSTTVNGAFGPVYGSIGGADTFCNQRAAAAGLTGDYRALASSDTNPLDPAWGEAKDRIATTSTRYVLVDGTVLAVDGEHMRAGPLLRPVSLDEFGSPLYAPRAAWTGSSSGWRLENPNCLNWARYTDPYTSVGADLTVADINWIEALSLSCSNQGRVVCVQVSNVAPTPPSCGNGVREAGEQCDGNDPAPFSCKDLGYEVGTVTCTSACRYDIGSCHRRGEAKLVFASSTTVNGAFGPIFGSIGGADTFCAQLAVAAGFSGEFRALASSDQNAADPAWGSASERIATYDLPYVLVDGTLVAHDGDQFRTGPLDHPIDLDESGGAITAPYLAWSGTGPGWTLETPTCGNWAGYHDSDGNGLVADLTSATASWVDTQTLGCGQQAHVVCIQN